MKVITSWAKGVGKKIKIVHPHGELEGYIVCRNTTMKRKLHNIDAGATNCGELADSMGLDKIAYLAHLDVNEGYRDRGIGGRMLDKFVGITATLPVEFVLLVANPESLDLWGSLLKFYRNHGFKLNRAYSNIMYRKIKWNSMT